MEPRPTHEKLRSTKLKQIVIQCLIKLSLKYIIFEQKYVLDWFFLCEMIEIIVNKA